MEITDKKNKIEEKINYIEDLEKNSKRKIISEYQNDYYSKCEQQRSLLNTLKKLEEKYDFYEKKINEIYDTMNDEKTKIDKLINQRL